MAVSHAKASPRPALPLTPHSLPDAAGSIPLGQLLRHPGAAVDAGIRLSSGSKAYTAGDQFSDGFGLLLGHLVTHVSKNQPASSNRNVTLGRLGLPVETIFRRSRIQIAGRSFHHGWHSRLSDCQALESFLYGAFRLPRSRRPLFSIPPRFHRDGKQPVLRLHRFASP